ncbi:unnamed protein product, partial [Angiostrongylus costaricensis]|uniref:Protein kinase domain-containing protein n=1 Tax=Angiostrongylus costaricensis TaxID=334426 RepID=A0A158PDA4_ANGCS
KFFSVFDNPRKLGEGVYGEVFATKYNGQLTALKVFPFFIHIKLSSHWFSRLASGLYPEEFLAAWDEYDNAYESENDRPSEYASEQQLFVAIGMLANENQVLSVLFQIAISLVVAEERLEFEHRDLHVGNVLVVENDDNLEYANNDYVVLAYVFMISEGTTVFRDLEDDEELFTGNGDYQFDIYRLMRNANQYVASD